MSIRAARQKIEALIKKFDGEKDFYLSLQYNEMNARKQFIDPFWEAFGWDLGNIHEVELSYPVEVGHREHLKFADYTFKISDRPVFIVEAKKPATDLIGAKERLNLEYESLLSPFKAVTGYCISQSASSTPTVRSISWFMSCMV